MMQHFLVLFLRSLVCFMNAELRAFPIVLEKSEFLGARTILRGPATNYENRDSLAPSIV